MSNGKTMKSAIYYGQRDVRVEEVPVPECGDNDVLIQNIYSGICGTDVAVYLHGPNTGHRVELGGQLGHETVSRVVAVGRNVTEFKVGDRVYPYPYEARGDHALAGMLGAFTEYVLCPNARSGVGLYPVDERIPDRLAALIEPFTVGTRAARQGHIKPGQNAIVFGAGAIGLSAALALKHFGAAEVLVCDVSDFRLGIVEQLGFPTCNTAREDLNARAVELFGEALSICGPSPAAHVYLDAAGADGILEHFMAHGCVESHYVGVAVSPKRQPIDMLHLTYSSKSIAGSGGYQPEDVRDVMAIMAADPEHIARIITHEFELDDISNAIETAADATRALSVVIRMSAA